MTDRDKRQETGGGSSRSGRTPEIVRTEAATWFEAVNRGELPAAQAEAFRVWLRADPAHAEAFRSIEQTWRDLALLDDAANWVGAAADSYAQPPAERTDGWRRRAAWLPALAACLVVAVAILTLAPWRTPAAAPLVQSFDTAVAQTRSIDLDDGSRVMLGAESAIDVAYAAGARNVVLKQGVAYFDVTPDAGRPFVVRAAGTEVTVVGTAFETWLGPDGARVSVGRGKVRVGQAGGDGRSPVRLLTAGDQVVSDLAGVPGEVHRFDPRETLAWRNGRFIYSDVPLRTVIADINRYRFAKVEIEDAGLAALQVTAAFNTGETESFLDGLAEAEGLRIEDRDGRAVLSAR